MNNRASVEAQLVAVQYILTDLIAELRTVNSEANLPPFNDMADRAEARLKGLNDV